MVGIIVLSIIIVLLLMPIRIRVIAGLHKIRIYLFGIKILTINPIKFMKKSATVAGEDPGEMQHRVNKLELLKYLKYKKSRIYISGDFTGGLSPALFALVGGGLTIVQQLVRDYIPLDYKLCFYGADDFRFDGIVHLQLGKIIYHYFYLEVK